MPVCDPEVREQILRSSVARWQRRVSLQDTSRPLMPCSSIGVASRTATYHHHSLRRQSAICREDAEPTSPDQHRSLSGRQRRTGSVKPCLPAFPMISYSPLDPCQDSVSSPDKLGDEDLPGESLEAAQGETTSATNANFVNEKLKVVSSGPISEWKRLTAKKILQAARTGQFGKDATLSTSSDQGGPEDSRIGTTPIGSLSTGSSRGSSVVAGRSKWKSLVSRIGDITSSLRSRR